MLLARPGWRPGVRWVETINDLDGLLVNVWRSLAMRPEETERHARWPVSELDLHARHAWLRGQREAITGRLRGDPEWCDPKAAGWWLWGQSNSIMGNWLTESGRNARPHIGPGLGVQSQGADIVGVGNRLSSLRTMSRDWLDFLRSDSVLGLHWWAPVAVFLDPPYAADTGRNMACYGETDSPTVAHDVREWCMSAGDDMRLRIALAGYDTEHSELERMGWSVVAWHAHGGMAMIGDGAGRANARRERVWFSPGCIKPDAPRQMGFTL